MRNRDVNQDELLMSVEESQAKGKSWCFGCDKHMPIREMKLITRGKSWALLQFGRTETGWEIRLLGYADISDRR